MVFPLPTRPFHENAFHSALGTSINKSFLRQEELENWQSSVHQLKEQSAADSRDAQAFSAQQMIAARRRHPRFAVAEDRNAHDREIAQIKRLQVRRPWACPFLHVL